MCLAGRPDRSFFLSIGPSRQGTLKQTEILSHTPLQDIKHQRPTATKNIVSNTSTRQPSRITHMTTISQHQHPTGTKTRTGTGPTTPSTRLSPTTSTTTYQHHHQAPDNHQPLPINQYSATSGHHQPAADLPRLAPAPRSTAAPTPSTPNENNHQHQRPDQQHANQ